MGGARWLGSFFGGGRPVEPERPGWEIGPEDGRGLAELAKAALVAAVRGEASRLEEWDLAPALRWRSALFVTAEAPAGEVRGCLGTLAPKESMAKEAFRLARDLPENHGRFPPLLREHLGLLRVEVSLLSALRPVQAASPRELESRLQPGIEGVVLEVRSTGRRSVLLPRVWERLHNDPGRFLDSVCAKQGEPEDFWRTRFREVRISTFETRCFQA